MYLADEFIKLAPQFLDVQINPETIREVREVRQRTVDDNETRSQQEAFRSLLRTLTAKDSHTIYSNLNRYVFDEDPGIEKIRMYNALINFLSHKDLNYAQEISFRKYLNRLMKDSSLTADDIDKLQTLAQLIAEETRHETNKQSHDDINISNEKPGQNAENHEN